MVEDNCLPGAGRCCRWPQTAANVRTDHTRVKETPAVATSASTYLSSRLQRSALRAKAVSAQQV